MSTARPWQICQCAACECGNVNKAALRNAHLKTLLAMGSERLLEVARAAYATGDVIGVGARFEIDPGVVSLALLRWKDVALGEAVPKECVKVLVKRPKSADEKMARRAIRAAEKTIRGQAKEAKKRIPPKSTSVFGQEPA